MSEDRIQAKVAELKKDEKHKGKDNEKLERLAKMQIGREDAEKKKKEAEAKRRSDIEAKVKADNPKIEGDALQTEIDRALKLDELEANVKTAQDDLEKAISAKLAFSSTSLPKDVQEAIKKLKDVNL